MIAAVLAAVAFWRAGLRPHPRMAPWNIVHYGPGGAVLSWYVVRNPEGGWIVTGAACTASGRREGTGGTIAGTPRAALAVVDLGTRAWFAGGCSWQHTAEA